ncbi:helix-turn-helix domain-containing protein [Dendronalium sp. ChiSLP03b]|uniref:helix-turn-helix domain-containing protein n=1 Tax=Dendronalium sp. ChiSLP03b TaxID=3075381 RepID=UPI00391CD997
MSSFASATLGQISTPVNILKEFLEIFNRRQKCKAAILSWLDGKHYYGIEWVRTTFENLAEILGYCRETISKHLNELIADGLIEKLPAELFPKDTANVYRLNPNWLPPIEFDKSDWNDLSKLLGLLKCPDILSKILSCRCEKIDISVPDNSLIHANNPPTLETTLKLFKSNNVVEEKKESEKQEPIQDTHYADELKEDSASNEQSPHEDSFSAPDQPTKQQLREVCTELKRLRINPDLCMRVMKKYWCNVSNAIARVKEAIAENWCDNPTGLFIASCESGAKPKNAITSDVKQWFDWARRQRIAIAMTEGVVYTPEGEAVVIKEMMQRYPIGET